MVECRDWYDVKKPKWQKFQAQIIFMESAAIHQGRQRQFGRKMNFEQLKESLRNMNSAAEKELAKDW